MWTISTCSILVGYIPVAKFDCFTKSMWSLLGYHLFHKCMCLLTELLIAARTEGVEMTCADGLVCQVLPIPGTYVADHLEQCLMTCCMEKCCPWCVVQCDNQKVLYWGTWRRLLEYSITGNKAGSLSSLKMRGYEQSLNLSGGTYLMPIFSLPLCLTFSTSYIKESSRTNWWSGVQVINVRFKSMNDFPALQHFKNSISTVLQWSGSEHKQMQCIFVSLLAGAPSVNDQVMAVTCSLVC